MRAGISQVCITPRSGVELSGFVAREQPSIGIHDDLYARALLLEQDGKRLLWLHCDLLALPRDMIRHLRKHISETLGFEESMVLMSATHSHAGPATVLLRQSGTVDDATMNDLGRRLVLASRLASEQLEPVSLFFREATCSVAVDRRRPGPHSHVDPAMPVLGFQRMDGTWLAVLANYALHNVALSSDNRMISADMAGFAADYARVRLPGRPVVLMTNGGCGNINPPGWSGGFEKLEQYGGAIGSTLVHAVEAARRYEPIRLTGVLEVVRLPLDVMSIDRIKDEFEKVVARCRAEFSCDAKIRRAMTEWRDETIRRVMEKGGNEEELDLQVMKIGPAFFVGIGAEVFSRMAVDLRAACGPGIYVVGLANGDIGYMPFQEAYPEGGYEIDLAFRFYGFFMIASGSFEKVRDHAVEMIKRLQ